MQSPGTALIQMLSSQHFQAHLWIGHILLPKGISLDAQRKHQLLEDTILSLTGIYIHVPHQSLGYKHVAEKRENCRNFTSSSLRDCSCCDNPRELSLQTALRPVPTHPCIPAGPSAYFQLLSPGRQTPQSDSHASLPGPIKLLIRVRQVYLSVLQLKQVQATMVLTIILNHLGLQFPE